MPHSQNRNTHPCRDDSGEDLKKEADAFAEEMLSERNLPETVRLLMTLKAPEQETWISRLRRRLSGGDSRSNASTSKGDRE